MSQLDVTNTDYMGGFQYVAGKLSFFPHAEGYVDITVGRKGTIVYNYVYQYKDHLGNNRLSFAKDPYLITMIGDPVPLTILEENHYYPFGLKHTNYNTNHYEFVEVENGNDYYINIEQLPAGGVSNYKYKYNGKEYQDELGLNMYDYGARNYDPALGRWMNIDPLAEQYRRWSPYNYVMNSPMILVDPDGMRVSYGDFIDNAGREGQSSQSNQENRDGNDEPPVNVFTPTSKDSKQKPFNDVFNEANKKGNYEVGDGIFTLYGHGGIGYVNNHNDKWEGASAESAAQFDDMMKTLSPAYRKFAVNLKLSFTLMIFSCNSATKQDDRFISMAQMVSKRHPNATIIGIDGFAMYGEDRNGKPTITSVSSKVIEKNGKYYSDYKGYIVTFKNGKEIKRELYSKYIKNLPK